MLILNSKISLLFNTFKQTELPVLDGASALAAPLVSSPGVFTFI